jgi:hypothetical protein
MIVDDDDDDDESDKDMAAGDVECEDSDDSSSTISEVSFSKRAFYLRLPNNLKFALVYDYDMVTSWMST